MEKNFQTPQWLCSYMVKLLIPPKFSGDIEGVRLIQDKTDLRKLIRILEPTAGHGNIVRELKTQGYSNITTPDDIFDWNNMNKEKVNK